MTTGLVQVDAALLWDWVNHFDLVNVVSSQLSGLGGVLKAQVHYALLDGMLVVSRHLQPNLLQQLQHQTGVEVTLVGVTFDAWHCLLLRRLAMKLHQPESGKSNKENDATL